jgi:lipopolysaccharide biosynthesis glycosyltransferase
MNVMIVTNSAYLSPAYRMLSSLFLHHPNVEMDIYLPYEDLTNEELKKLSEYVSSFAGKTLLPLYVGDAFKSKVTSRNGINVETYYRILGIDLLPQDIDRILYLDVDLIVRGDLTEFYETDFCGAPFVVCEDIYGEINGFHEANKRRLGIPAQYSYFNAGVMLYNLDFLRETDAAEQMLSRIYKDYERYEYNDQDVMNEMYYDRVRYVGWDAYNCPPVWCYLNREELAKGHLVFADYNELRELSKDPERMMETWQNVTEQIYDHAKIIHYMGNTKPWSKTREESRLYQLFDRAYYEGEYNEI